MGVAGVNKSSIAKLPNGDAEVDLTLGPLTEYRGLYLMCVIAVDETG